MLLRHNVVQGIPKDDNTFGMLLVYKDLVGIQGTSKTDLYTKNYASPKIQNLEIMNRSSWQRAVIAGTGKRLLSKDAVEVNSD